MTNLPELSNHLKSLIKLLQDEKHALTHNDGNTVLDIVEKKNSFLEKMAQFKGLGAEKDPNIMAMIGEINSLQETNLLLTKQALGFQNSLLEGIAKSYTNSANTYSIKGSKGTADSPKIIDQSV